MFERMPNGDINRMKTAKKIVAEYLTEYLNYGTSGFGKAVTTEDIYIVWFSKTLQNWKALLSTDVVSTGIYFEVTFNGDKNEAYLDHYKKVVNRVVTDGV